MGRGMVSMMWLLCLLLSMDMTPVQSNKIPYFGLFISPDLYNPSMDTFCLHSSKDLEGFSEISVDLKTSSGTINLYTVKPDSPTWHCQSFQVPEPSDATEKVTIVVQGKKIEDKETEDIKTEGKETKDIKTEGKKTEGKMIEFSSKELTLRKKNTGTFIQTDKAIYKPGQKVMFHIVTLDQDMEVLNKTYPLVELQDPQKNRLAQWKDVHAKSRIAEGSFQLSPETQPGTFNIKTEDASETFIVDKYVLPKFDVATDGPSSISMMDEKLPLTVLGLYTYGEKVTGNATLKVCQKRRPRYWYWGRKQDMDDKNDDLCFNHNAKTDNSGKVKLEMDLSQFSLRHSDYTRELEVEASLEEEGTDVKFSAPKKTISIKSELTKLTFKDTKRYYQPGAPYRGKLVLESYDGKPLPDKKVNLEIQVNGRPLKESYVTDSNGEVSFQLPTSKWGTDSVSLRATTDDKDEPYIRDKVSIRYGSAFLHLDGIHVTTESSVYIHPVKSSAQCHENVKVTVDYTIEEQEGDDIEFFYLVLVNNRVSMGGEKKVKKTKSLSGSFQFPLKIVDTSPSGKLFVFTVTKTGGIAADTTEVKVTACLKHKVSLTFSEAEALPGSDIKLRLQANGGSMCAVRAVDKSVVMMKPEAELTESKLQNLVQAKRSHINSQRLDYNYCRGKESKPSVNTDESDSSDGWGWGGWSSYPEKKKDLQNIIQDMGLYILCSWDIVAPTTCKKNRIMPGRASRPPGMAARPMGIPPSAKGAPLMSVASGSISYVNDEEDDDHDESSSEPRTFFPETWLWEMKEVPKSGSAEMSASVPDTITEWRAQMFCAGPGGLGLSSAIALKTFQPFFVELTLPFSVKRGETFPLKASVFNYMDQPMEIAVSQPSSNEFRTRDNKVNEKSFCLPGGVKRTVSWDVTPTIIGQMNITIIAEAVKSRGLCGEQETVIPKKGRRDVVTQSVLVVPEGTVVEKTHNSLLICDGNSVSEKVKFEFPSSYVPGSEKIFFSVCGDIMGPSMSNIGNLLAMSYGCGEQNMVLFAPNIYILEYLEISDQMNPTVLAKGKDMLEKGYTRQLMYKHPDGPYSAFGKSDGEGSTWLTAFVLKCLSQAKKFIYIDEDVLNQGMKWMKEQQKPNGCFKATGRLLHNGMKGGVDDEVSLTSYVVSSLLESGAQPNDPTVERAMKCIVSEPLDNATLYKLALMAYAFTLANDGENRAAVLQKLDEQATKKGGLLYWTQEPTSSSDSYWSKPNSVNVEMTGYVLLSHATWKKSTTRTKRASTNKNLGDMAAMVRWLSKQRNANGGFTSTQDTVVALQALSEYGSHLSNKSGEMTVDMTSENGFHHQFKVDNDNRLLLQKIQLAKTPGEYTVTVSGTGTIVMQAVQRHNVLPDAKKDAFVLTATPECVNSDLMKMSLEFWYTGNRNSTNMVIVKVNMLSGYEIDSPEKLKEQPMVKRVETEQDSVSFYVEEVTTKTQTLELQARKIVPVSGLKPATISMFDYYMPEEETTISYLINC